jgi:hypothetical protein
LLVIWKMFWNMFTYSAQLVAAEHLDYKK